MNNHRFFKRMRFVVDAVCCHIEKLPTYDISPEEVSLSIQKKPYPLKKRGCSSFVEASQYHSQQGVKRSCGHSQKSVREKVSLKKN